MSPWLWTKDGDAIVDNCNDSTRDNFAVAAGVPGDVLTKTIIDGTVSDDLATKGSLYISNVAHKDFISPSSLYLELSGVADANSSGGERYETAAPTAWEENFVFNLTRTQIEALAGRKFYGFIRFYDAGSGVTVRPYYLFDTLVHYGATVTLTTSAAFNLTRFNSLNVPELKTFFLDEGSLSSSGVQLGAAILRTGANADWRIDYYTCLYSPLIKIDGGVTGNNGFILDGSMVQDYTYATRLLGGSDVSTVGDEIHLEPNQYNHLISLMGDDATASTVASTLTYNAIRVTPRWSLL